MIPSRGLVAAVAVVCMSVAGIGAARPAAGPAARPAATAQAHASRAAVHHVGALTGAAATVTLGQKVAVPSYIPPQSTAAWSSLIASASDIGFLVANVANGPGPAASAAWQPIITQAHSAGTKVLGYVDSGYLGGSTPPRKTALGDTDTISWLVQAEQDVDRWYAYYGSSMDGIFIDDGMNTCGPTPGSNGYVDLYRQLNDYIHGNHPGSLTVINPGITVPDCYEDTADVIASYEGNAYDYLHPTADRAAAQWQLDGDPAKFWNIIYDVVPDGTTIAAGNTSQAHLSDVMQSTKQNNAGYIYLTEDTLPNPYDTAPLGQFWTDEIAAARSNSTAVPSAPCAPQVRGHGGVYSTGVDLSWNSSPSDNIVGYEVFRNGLHVGSVGNYFPDRTDFTDTGLTPATAYSYTIAARHRDGNVSQQSAALHLTTDIAWGNPPSAPSNLTASDVVANGARLSWTASTATNDPVAFYDVYVDGVRRATVDASVTTVHLGYLRPGNTYAVTIVARTTSDASSAPSAVATLTTPAPAPIDNPLVDFGAATTTFTATFNLGFAIKHVYIDTDNSTATGFTYQSIGADFMIEGATLYRHDPAAGTGWGWIPVTLASGPLTTDGDIGQPTVWQVPSSVFDPSARMTVIFNGVGADTNNPADANADSAPISSARAAS